MKSLAELKAIKEKMLSQVSLREESNAAVRVLVAMGTCGIAAGARPVLNALAEEAAKQQLHSVLITQTGCTGNCQYEPVVEVYDADGTKTTYVNMTAEKAVRVVNDHLVNGNVVTEFTAGANS